MLNCPKCQSQMKETLPENGKAIVDYCETCGGIWLDQFEIRQFLTHPNVLWRLELEGVLNPKPASLPCPRCLHELHTGDFPNQNLQVECCSNCRGFFFDNGELHQAMKGNIARSTMAKKNTPDFGTLDTLDAEALVQKSKSPAEHEELPGDLRLLIKDDEKIIWAARPNFLSFFVGSPLSWAGALVFFASLFLALKDPLHPELAPLIAAGATAVSVTGFMLLHFWQTLYVVTENRVICKKGITMTREEIALDLIEQMEMRGKALKKTIVLSEKAQVIGGKKISKQVVLRHLDDSDEVYQTLKTLRIRAAQNSSIETTRKTKAA